MNSVCNIMRAARFWSFDKQSMCVSADEPKVIEP